MSECPMAGVYGVHSESWHEGGTCIWCGARAQVEVVYFPKSCKHGRPLKLVKKFSGAWWYEPQCKECDDERRDAEEAEGTAR